MKIMFTTSNILRLLMPRPHIELSTDIVWLGLPGTPRSQNSRLCQIVSRSTYIHTGFIRRAEDTCWEKKAFCQRLIMLARGIMKAVRNINITNDRETASVAL